jgi:hypothetical protein
VLSPRLSAQGGARSDPDVSKANVRLGRLLLNPAIALTNLGLDTNVFNEIDRNTPRRDFTVTVTPQTELWLRLGRSWVTGNVREDLVWYKTYASERTANDSLKVGWQMPLNRLAFNADAAYLNTRDRPGFEIDARSQRYEFVYRGGVALQVGPKTSVGATGNRKTIRFDSVSMFDGVNLRDALNRVETNEAITASYQLTPLTGLTLDIGREQDRFDRSPFRDSDSTRVIMGVKLDQFALIKGDASIGFRDFQPLSPDLPEYKGVTAGADLTYVAFGRTRVGLQAFRDIQYSFQIEQPYYLLTGIQASISQQVFGPVQVGGRIGTQRLAYRNRLGDSAAAADRLDHVRTYGGTIAYRMGNDVRVGFNIDWQHRTSPVFARDYHGLKFGTSVTYGL